MSALTVKQPSNFDGFPKAAELIEISGAHNLEALDRAHFNQLLQVAHDSDRMMEPGASWEVTFASLRRAASKHESNDRIRESLRRLRRTEVTVRYISTKDGKPRKLETSLLTFTDTAEDNSSAATIVFSIPDPLRLILVRSNRWGRIRCEVSYAMKSKYAIALYEMAALRINMDRCVETMPLETFRDKLGVPPGAYERSDNFMQFVIRPALLEVNKLSDLNVRIELERQHARAPAHAVTFSWRRKKGDEFRDALKELQRPKAGRRKRLTAPDPRQTELTL